MQAAFGAPIGGVLFSLEEASTVWSRKMAWRCFICTTVAVFTLAQLHPRWDAAHPAHGISWHLKITACPLFSCSETLSVEAVHLQSAPRISGASPR